MEFRYDPHCKIGVGIDKDLETLQEKHNTADKLGAELAKEKGTKEFYVIGKDWKWCYIHTHETHGKIGYPGPFFARKNKLG